MGVVAEATGRALLLVDQDMSHPEAHPLGSGRAVVFSARCPGKSVNEDAAALIPFDDESGVLAVADGMGGAAAGDRAARLSLEALAAAVERARREGGLRRAAILDGFEQANRDVQELRIGAGCTLAAVEIHGSVVRSYHAGDSAILIFGQRGRRRQLTVCHSPVGYGVEAGLIDEREAMDHVDRHLVSNAVGSEDMKIEIGPQIELRPRDTVVVATDGLFDNLHVDEIIDTARRGDLTRSVEQLAGVARKRMLSPAPGDPTKQDDLTLIGYRLTPDAG